MPDDLRTTGSLRLAPTAFGPYDLFMLGLCVVSIGVLAADSLFVEQPQLHAVLDVADTIFCALFMADFARSFWRAPDRLRYMLRGGWLDFVSSIPSVGILRLGRLSRIFRIVRLLRALRSARTISAIISRNRKQSALLAAGTVSLLLVIFGSLAILQFEEGPEANILGAGDALWWAYSTLTTTGYGDRYPVTPEGRLVAAVLMGAGVGVFSTLSALVVSWFVHTDVEERDGQIEELKGEIAALRTTLSERASPTIDSPAGSVEVLRAQREIVS